MKNTIITVFIVGLVGSFCAQEDSSVNVNFNIPNLNASTEFSLYGLKIPQDSLTYDEYVGEYIPPGLKLADGWRIDTINGGYNKELYTNPYIEDIRFEKQSGREMVVYRYQKGKLYTGKIEDTLTLRFIPNKIKGYLFGEPYYESESLTVIFRGECIKGRMQGRGVLVGNILNLSIYKSILLSECQFENGEMVGLCKFWDLNSVDFEVYNKSIYLRENIYDYIDLKKRLNYTEIKYIKGFADWTHWNEFSGEGKILSKKIANLKNIKN